MLILRNGTKQIFRDFQQLLRARTAGHRTARAAKSEYSAYTQPNAEELERLPVSIEDGNSAQQNHKE